MSGQTNDDETTELTGTVLVREVGPRDGFQNEPETISTDDKVALIDRLARTGLRRLEVTSFVRADVIPQLADGAEVLRRIDVPEGVSRSVLIPNERGLDHALELRDRFDEISVFLSASETHNRKNVNRTIAASLDGLQRVLARAGEAGLRRVAVISTSFGCPFEGVVAPERVFEIAAALRDAGAVEIGFGDTTGMANPRQVRQFFLAAREALGPDVQLTGHFHNTRGLGLANVLGALEAGCRSFESSFGEARRLPGAGGRDRQHRDRGPAGDAARDGPGDRRRPRRSARRQPRGSGGARPTARLPQPARGRDRLAPRRRARRDRRR